MTGPSDRYLIVTDAECGVGYSLGWAVGPDGDAWPILVDDRIPPGVAQNLPVTPAGFRHQVPHEMTGKLPAEFEQFTCGGPTRAGKPCRNRVDALGMRCPWHPEPVEAVEPAQHHQPPAAPQDLLELLAQQDQESRP